MSLVDFEILSQLLLVIAKKRGIGPRMIRLGLALGLCANKSEASMSPPQKTCRHLTLVHAQGVENLHLACLENLNQKWQVFLTEYKYL